MLGLSLTRSIAQTCDVSLSSTPITCPGDADGSLSVSGAPGLYTYFWDHDPSLTAAVATGLGAGIYTVLVTDTSGCSAELEFVLADPIIPPLGTITVDHISCADNNDGSVTFALDPGLNNSWEWAHDGSETSATLTNLGPGGYGVVIDDTPCPSVIWEFLGDPYVTIDGSVDYCPSDPPLLTAGMHWGFQPDLYLWSTGETTSSIQVEPGMTGDLELTAIDTSIGCVVSADVFLNQLPSPFVQFAIPDSMCQHSEFTVHTVDTDADSLIWRWNGNGLSNETDPIVSFAEPFWQPISLQGFDLFGCGNEPVSDSIYIHPLKPADFIVEQIPCTPMVLVQLQSLADSCAFFIGDSLVENDCYSSFTFDNRRYRIYDHTFIATQTNHCNDTTYFTLDVRTEPTLFLPTAFTPNNDGMNDEWPGPVDIPDRGFELQIFDRWGEGLWRTTDTMDKWNGADLPTGIYVYTMRMRDPCEPTNEVARKGFVTLLR